MKTAPQELNSSSLPLLNNISADMGVKSGSRLGLPLKSESPRQQ